MPNFDTIEIKLCEACVMIVANGEYGGDDDGGDARAERHVALLGTDAPHLSVACVGECDHGFSTDTCGACGDSHGGTWHDGVILRPVKRQHVGSLSSEWV